MRIVSILQAYFVPAISGRSRKRHVHVRQPSCFLSFWIRSQNRKVGKKLVGHRARTGSKEWRLANVPRTFLLKTSDARLRWSVRRTGVSASDHPKSGRLFNGFGFHQRLFHQVLAEKPNLKLIRAEYVA